MAALYRKRPTGTTPGQAVPLARKDRAVIPVAFLRGDRYASFVMLIGVDIDDVIADTERVVRQHLNARYGLRLRREDVTDFSLEKLAGLSPGDVQAFLEDFHRSGGYRSMAPIPGAREALTRLAARHRIVLVTARPEETRPDTEAWLAEHGIPYHALIFSNGAGKHGLQPYDRFVEDRPAFALELAEAGVPVLLFDAPWNRRVAHPRIRRVRDWQEALRHLDPAATSP